MRRVRLLLCLCLTAWLPTALAHSIQHRLEVAPAVVLSLSYGDDEPYARESYTLQRLDALRPPLAGQTDLSGRVVFMAHAGEQWRLKSQTANGHGLVLEFTVPAMPIPAPAAVAAVSPPPAAGPNRASLALFGLSLILAGFGAYQLHQHRRRS